MLLYMIRKEDKRNKILLDRLSMDNLEGVQQNSERSDVIALERV